MSEPSRLAALRRLYLLKLSEVAKGTPEELKDELAKVAMDEALGPEWRDEIKDAGFGMDPIGTIKSRVDLLPSATREAGYSGEDVTPPKEKSSLLLRLIKALSE